MRVPTSNDVLPAALEGARRALRAGHYARALRRFLDYLDALDLVDVTERELLPPLSPGQLAEIVRELPLPSDLASFYGQVGGVSIRWASRDGAMSGAIRLRPLPKVLRGLSFERTPNARFEESARSKPLDLVSNESATRLLLSRSGREGATHAALVYECRLPSTSGSPSDVGSAALFASDDVPRLLGTYLELAFLARGFLFWQSVWLLGQAAGGPPTSRHLPETRLWRVAARAFPDLFNAGFLAPLDPLVRAADTAGTFVCVVRSVADREVCLQVSSTGILDAEASRLESSPSVLVAMLWESAPPESPLREAVGELQILDEAWLDRHADHYVHAVEVRPTAELDGCESWAVTVRVADPSLIEHLSPGWRWLSTVEP